MTAQDALRRRLLSAADSLAPPAPVPTDLEALDRLGRRGATDVTIAVATSDDFDGAFFTLSSLCLYHPEVTERAEILLLDNHPTGPEAGRLRGMVEGLPNGGYLPVRSVRSTAVRDLLVRRAAGAVVVVLDSHVLVAPGGLAAAVAHLRDPACGDIVHGPLLNDAGRRVVGTHMDPVWRGGMFGTWGVDDRIHEAGAGAFEIPLHGLGAFAVRRDRWPGLNPHFVGFGGEEGYLQEKARRHGGRSVCLPEFRWIHRFGHPRGVKFDLSWEARVRNYVIGWTELGLDVESIRTHFVDAVGGEIGAYFDQVRADVCHPLWRYDGIVVLNDDAAPGRWRQASRVPASVSVAPRRLPLPTLPRGRDGARYAVAAGARYARYWGWREFAVVGDRALAGCADADALAALLDQAVGVEAVGVEAAGVVDAGPDPFAVCVVVRDAGRTGALPGVVGPTEAHRNGAAATRRPDSLDPADGRPTGGRPRPLPEAPRWQRLA